MPVRNYEVDFAHSTIGFCVRHLMITTVPGAFLRWSGTFALDTIDPTRSQIEVEVDAASVDTSNQERDEHLRSPEFFDVATYPTITFKATTIEPGASSESVRIVGDFTLRGVTKSLTLTVEHGGRAKDSQGRERAGYHVTGEISRKEFGVAWNEVYAGGTIVAGDKVKILVDLQLVPLVD